MTKKHKLICRTWDRIEENDPDISTERLFAMVEMATGYDAGYICTALMARRIFEETKKWDGYFAESMHDINQAILMLLEHGIKPEAYADVYNNIYSSKDGDSQ